MGSVLEHVYGSVAWSSVLVYLAIPLLSWLVYYWIIQPLTSPIRKIPGLPWNPFTGNIRAVMRGQAMESSTEWVKKYGPILRYYFFFGMERVLVADPAAMKHILVTNSKNYIKPPSRFKTIKLVLGNGLVTSEGEEHRTHRKLINPAFSVQSIKEMVPVFEKCGRNLLQLWHQQLAKADTAVVDIGAALTNMSLDAIGECAFGYQFNALSNMTSENETTCTFRRMITGVGLSWKMMLPFWEKLPFADVREMNNGIALVNKTVQQVIQKKKQSLQEKETHGGRDLLDMLLLAHDEETGIGLTDKQLKDQVMTFLLAGHETTSTGLSWIVLQMAEYPDIQQRVREEARQLLTRTDAATLTWDTLDSMTYTHAVVKECLRLLPPVPLSLRQSLQDDVICDYFIPAGTIILLCPGVMMRQESNYKDALTFNPDRFLGDNNDTSPYNFLPFLLGPRMCIGHKFAMAQMKLMLALAVNEFKFSTDPDYKYTRKQRITMRPDPSLKLKISLAD